MKKAFVLYVFIIIMLITVAKVPISNSAEAISEAKDKLITINNQNLYKIGSGDVLEIITWKEPDFSKEVFVRTDGKFTFPLLNDIQAAGLTSVEVKKAIEGKLKEFIEGPFVTVIVKSPESQKFYILGEVAKTGEYQITKELTVLQAFALAGGFTEWASKNEIILLRRENGTERIIRVNYKNIIKGKDLSQNQIIKANDTIIVP